MIQLQRLEGFYWVAREQGYAKAARAFPYPITGPGVQQQVRRLEADMGVQLVQRRGKDQVILTPAGRTLFAFVAPFLDQLKGVERALRAGEAGGTLRLHATGLHVRHLLPPWLRRLHARRPDVEVELTEVRMPDWEALRSGEADVIIDHAPHLPRGLTARVVGTMTPYVVINSRHSSLKSPGAHFRGLQGEPLVAYSPDLSARALQLQALAQQGIRPARIHSADSAEAILAFVASGLGFSLIPWLGPTGPRRAGVVAIPLSVPGGSFPVHAVFRSGGPSNPLVESLLALAPRAP